MFTEGCVRVHEDDTQLLEVLTHLVVDDLAFVLRAHAGEVLLLGLGDAQRVESVADLRGQVVPRATSLLGRLDVVVDVVEVDCAEVTAPCRHRFGEEDVQTLVTEVAHPLRLALHLRDLFDDLVREALARLEDIVFGLAETPLIFLVRRLHLVGFCGHVRASTYLCVTLDIAIIERGPCTRNVLQFLLLRSDIVCHASRK